MTRYSLRRLAVPLMTLVVAAGVAAPAAAVGTTSAAAGATSDAAAAAIRPVVGCRALETLPAPPSARVTSAVPVTRDGHEFCDVHGYLAPVTQFEVLLPRSTWRGDYLQQGCGGFCGHVDVSLSDPARTSGYQTPFAPLSRGEMVVAADDQGHETAVNSDGLWARDDLQLRAVYGYSSEHDLALAAKVLMSTYYGRRPSYSYFSGVSDGGHEALVLAQRYPGDFDGIIAGAPINNLAPWAGMAMPWQVRANQDSAGRPILTSEKLPALHAAVMRACADRTGVIRDPRTCDFQPESLLCPAGTDDRTCLTGAEAGAVRREYRGATDAQGRNLFDGGQPYGSELAWDTWLVKPAGDRRAPGDTYAAPIGRNFLNDMAFLSNPPPTSTLADARFTEQQHDRLQVLGGIYNATDPDLRPFRARGGKIIIYHGWADQAVSPFTSVNYYGAVVRTVGGLAASQTFSRLYMVPGLYHCPCGLPVDGDPATSLQLLPQLTRWVEHGDAPGTLDLPVTASTTGHPPSSISVPPTNPLRQVDVRGGLNSDYDYVGLRTTYRSGNALWCRQVRLTFTCSHDRT